MNSTDGVIVSLNEALKQAQETGVDSNQVVILAGS
jgi:hypothetical protein